MNKFGQYGEIIKMVMTKRKGGGLGMPVAIYVTFARREDASTCIEAINTAAESGDGIIR
jgi:CCR4-NOT transcription complex subunit 4